MTKLPPAVQPRVCCYRRLCSGAPAVIKCLSCSIYDPKQSAFFCKECFDVQHPWYRVGHIFADIGQDESVEYSLKIAQRATQAMRYEKEGKDIMHSLQYDKTRLESVADDEYVDDIMRVFGRRAVALENRTAEIQSRLRDKIDAPHEVYTGNLKTNIYHELDPTVDLPETAEDVHGMEKNRIYEDTINKILSGNKSSLLNRTATVIQRAFRGYLSRRIISYMMMDRIVRVWNAELGREFYFDRANQSSTWVLSPLVRRVDMHRMQYVQEDHSNSKFKWSCKKIVTAAMVAANRGYEVDREADPEQGEQNVSKVGSSVGMNKLLDITPCGTPKIRCALSIITAAQLLNRFARCIIARRKILAKSNEIYRRVWDEDSGSFYYANLTTGETSWLKPSIYLTTEPPVLLGPDESSGSKMIHDEPIGLPHHHHHHHNHRDDTNSNKQTKKKKKLKRYPLTTRAV